MSWSEEFQKGLQPLTDAILLATEAHAPWRTAEGRIADISQEKPALAMPDGVTALQEAFRRYKGDQVYSEATGEMESFDDYGYAEASREAFVAGSAWAERRNGMKEALVWMMNQPRLTGGGNGSIILGGFVRQCAKEHGIDLAGAVLEKVYKS